VKYHLRRGKNGTKKNGYIETHLKSDFLADKKHVYALNAFVDFDFPAGGIDSLHSQFLFAQSD
jgi:hypothetical protein